ncbi:MDR family oxidoreductase [Ferrovibrio sp.]|uniref:MDR family oxidoreductase n=1 Tax=Ferrovibrio sp. TaxID=1917215 RepID=UPI001B3D9E71|nr:MDR family oxidoreductase [Ferrovibrio sp.]MBP7062857.1 oxidoreductase [Ferrovibrio sp.]
MTDSFRAVLIEDVDGKPKAGFKQLTLADLPQHDVLVEIAYSTVNYKDGLALTGGRIARKLPMVAGIDLAGTVVESADPEWKPGDRVLVNGYGLSETQWGGYSRYQRVKGEWLVSVPDHFSLAQAMAVGTAGYTAMLCVMALEDAGLVKDERADALPVLVTGAAGGVGSVAVALLAARGFKVVAATGRPETHEYLRGLGASDFIDRAELAAKAPALAKERWAAVIDSVGGQTLASAISQTQYGGWVAACGMAGGNDVPASVFPFILRNVSLLGIDSVMAPSHRRRRAWWQLGTGLPLDKLDAMTETQPLSAIFDLAPQILAGKIRGRTVIDVNA